MRPDEETAGGGDVELGQRFGVPCSTAAAIRRRCRSLGRTDLEEDAGPIGGESVEEPYSLRYGLRHTGLHVYASAPAQSGRHSLVRNKLLGHKAETESTPRMCYVNNCRSAGAPTCLQVRQRAQPGVVT